MRRSSLIPLFGALIVALTMTATGQPAATTAAAPQTITAARTLTVYYFHRTMRCGGCKQFEANAREAIEAAFARELGVGSIIWRPTNLDDEGNDRFEKLYELEDQSLVLSLAAGDAELRWKRLDEAWEYQFKKDELSRYIVAEMKSMLQ